ncbi:MAG TPA: hypothetical protein VHD87_00510, partial [Acidimicrobiales bacterium]|nr:hypothetical protein [Acidimicrobiales bacterium]
MTRRVLPLLCLALALTACGKNNKSSASTTTAPPTTTTTAPPPTTPVAPPAGLSLVVSLQHPTVARDEPVEGFLTATNTTPKGTPDLHLTFPGKCDVGLLLYSQGKVVA